MQLNPVFFYELIEGREVYKIGCVLNSVAKNRKDYQFELRPKFNLF